MLTEHDIEAFLKAMNKNPEYIQTNSFKLICLLIETEGILLSQFHAGIEGFTADVEYKGQEFMLTVKPKTLKEVASGHTI